MGEMNATKDQAIFTILLYFVLPVLLIAAQVVWAGTLVHLLTSPHFNKRQKIVWSVLLVVFQAFAAIPYWIMVSCSAIKVPTIRATPRSWFMLLAIAVGMILATGMAFVVFQIWNNQ